MTTAVGLLYWAGASTTFRMLHRDGRDLLSGRELGNSSIRVAVGRWSLTTEFLLFNSPVLFDQSRNRPLQLRRAFPLSRPKRRQAGAESLLQGKRGMHPVFIQAVNRFRVMPTGRVETQCSQGSRCLKPESRQRSLCVPKPIS